MSNTIARIKKQNKHFEILVDIDSALKLKEGKGSTIQETLAIDAVYTDHKKGFKAADSELETSFGTTDIYEVATRIVKEGEIVLPLEYKSKERDEKLKQVIDFIVKNATDAGSGNPPTPQRVEDAIKEAGISIENRPINAQIMKILRKLKEVIPLKVESKRLNLKIPSEYTGVAYGVIQDFKEKEEWKDDGTLVCRINIPAGLVMEFYDKINTVSHGNIIAEEIKDE